MHYKDIDKVIISQEKFARENSNSVSNRIQILNSKTDLEFFGLRRRGPVAGFGGATRVGEQRR